MAVTACRDDCAAWDFPTEAVAVVLPRTRASSVTGIRAQHADAAPASMHPFITSPGFRRLFIGDVLVKVAERYFALTFAWWLLAGPHANGGRLSVLLTAESVAILLVGALVGPLIDRSNKKRCMVASAMIQAVVVAAVAGLLAFDALSFARLCVAAIVLGAIIPIFEGAAAAALPNAVSDRQLPSAAALHAMTVEFSNVIAAALSAIVLATGGFAVAAAVNAGLYAAAGFFLLRLRGAAFAPSAIRRPYLADLRAGIAYIARQRALAAFVAIYVGELLLIVPLLVLIPMLVEATRGGTVTWVAILETSFSIGAVSTALVLSFGDARRQLYRRSFLALLVLAGAMILLTRIGNLAAMIPDVAIMGASVAVLMGLANVLFQHVVPDHMKGRFFGVVETLGAAATPLGYAMVGLAFGWGGVGGILLATASGLVVLAACVLRIPRVAVIRVRYGVVADRLQGGQG